MRWILSTLALIPCLAFGDIQSVSLSVSGVTTGNIPVAVSRPTFPVTGTVRAISVTKDEDDDVSLVVSAGGQTLLAVSNDVASAVFYPLVAASDTAGTASETYFVPIVLHREQITLTVDSVEDDKTNAVSVIVLIEK